MDSPMFTVLPDGVAATDAASLFVNPLTVVGFVHTAAASQLGRMLVKHCKEEGVALVNIVRKQEQVDTLKALGSEYIVNSSSPTFKADLLAAIKTTGATIGFDATGGGTLGMDILAAMNQSLRETYPETVVGWYGPPQKHSVYKYGGLNKSTPSEFTAAVGVGNWTWGGWLMFFHYDKYPAEHRAAG